ncbi:MAG: pseudaminic acid synthase [Hyphomicrobium sp.]|nr:pseudaminic acid synthase [Hyphomicrobium sp.]MCC7250951.1 pseudaminic acid synthase [Hyphomicrobium sp.]
MRPTIEIAGRRIGGGNAPYVIAELSGNHNGNIDCALRLIQAAKEACVDAVKLQTYTADTITIDHDGPEFLVKGGLWGGRKLYDLYREAHTPWEWHEALFAKGRELGITVFSTPFDSTAVDFLEDLGAPAYKIASFEVVDLPLIRRVAATRRPIIMSTGLADFAEIAEAVDAAREAGCSELALLHCVSAYPAPPEDMNLKTISHLASAFDVVTGLSDHTLGTVVATTAIGAGAAIIEKHVTLRRAEGGPDAAFSLEPHELERFVKEARIAHSALGQASYAREPSERDSLVFRRSLYAVSDIAAGEVLTTRNVRSIRPGYGLPPKMLPDLLGRRAAREIRRGTPLSLDLIR